MAIINEIGELDESDTLSTLSSLTNKIEVTSADERHICYKQNLFIDYGWCYVYDASNKEGGIENNYCIIGNKYYKGAYMHPIARALKIPQ